MWHGVRKHLTVIYISKNTVQHNGVNMFIDYLSLKYFNKHLTVLRAQLHPLPTIR